MIKIIAMISGPAEYENSKGFEPYKTFNSLIKS
jgi:hypothetical protein